MEMCNYDGFMWMLESDKQKFSKASEWIGGLPFKPVMIAYEYNWGYLYVSSNEQDMWCRENLDDGYDYTHAHFAFETLEDAMAFKMRWL